MAGGDQTRSLRIRDERDVVVRRLDRAQAGLLQLHALLCELTEIWFFQARLENDRAGNDTHAARPVVGKAPLCGNGQRLYPLDVAWSSRHMDFRRGDRRRSTAVQVA